jgi:5-methylcytosine-specific restriction endonuclease McrA
MKPTTKSLRNKCDKLLTPIVKKLHPRCLLCGEPTQVAHHHIHKSKSSALRYDLDNLIPLCHSCHLALHCNESYYASKIVKIKGIKWFDKLEKRKNKIVKTNLAWYEENLKYLNECLKVIHK